jgi:YidC/Oxa1 family membrane protein insertase
MEFFGAIFNIFIYQPLFNALILLYQYLPGRDFGLAILALTFLIRLILYPLSLQAIRSQKALADLQPKIKEIQQKFKDDRQAQGRAMMELYRKEKINPFSGCLPLILQLPILIALWRIFFKVEALNFKHLYPFIPHPGEINPWFLGKIDLSLPHPFLAILAGIFQFWQGKMLAPQKTTFKKSDFSQLLQKQMLYFFPIFTILILLKFPSALALYWLSTTIFSILQQYLVLKK